MSDSIWKELLNKSAEFKVEILPVFVAMFVTLVAMFVAIEALVKVNAPEMSDSIWKEEAAQDLIPAAPAQAHDPTRPRTRVHPHSRRLRR